MIAHGHAAAAASADDEPLQERRTFARGAWRRSGRRPGRSRAAGAGFRSYSSQVMYPAWASGENSACHCSRGSARPRCGRRPSCACGCARTRTPRHSGDCAGRDSTWLCRAGPRRSRPACGPAARRRGNGSPCCAERAARWPGAEPVRRERLEEQAHAVLDLLVGIDHHAGPRDRRRSRPAGGTRSSPRRALLRMPPRRRARSTCSSASLIVPFRPRSSRSLKCAGS